MKTTMKTPGGYAAISAAKNAPKKPPVKPVVTAPMPPPVATMPAAPRKSCASNLGKYLHPKGGMKAPVKPVAAKVTAVRPTMKPAMPMKTGKKM